MLYLYQSDRLEALSELLAAVVRQPLSEPLVPETVIVQSKGMGRWISLQLSRRHGICANIDYPLPAAFLWQLANRILGALPTRSPFAPEVMTWRLLEILGRLPVTPETRRLHSYLQGGDPLRRYRLAFRIADTFDQYLVYRPDWISAWEQARLSGLGPDEAWQAVLWRALAGGPGEGHRVRIGSRLIERLDRPEPLSALPERIVLFAISSLPPVYLAIIEALARRIDVCLFALNPCRMEWGEIRDRREIARLGGDVAPDELFLELGNPLLASLGKQGRDFFDTIQAAFPELVSLFEPQDAPPRSLLETLQRDILELVDREQLGPQPLPAGDRSLQIHVCHSPMRELEVLHDQLLALFEADPQLEPDQVVVLMPDIAEYAPYIDAVFGFREGVPAVPYSIADRGLAEQHPLLETFLSLLELPQSRLEAEWVLGLLEQPAVLRRFGLVADDLPLLRRWVHDAGIRWGRNGAHKAALGLPADEAHTWEQGLTRLLLGYALPIASAEARLPLFEGILPCDEVEGGRALVLGQFAAYLDALFECSELLRQPLPLGRWCARLNQLVEQFFLPEPAEEAALQGLRACFEHLLEVAELAAGDEEVEYRLIAAWLVDQLRQPGGGGGFLSGAVTFASLVPMRSLPFQVICLLGLNDTAFPRHQHPPGFDLMANNPRIGDRSRRLDDRYLFLETLLSARQSLYISYVGRDVRDNSALPPSVLVAELIEVAAASVCFPGGEAVAEAIVTEHPLQPFDQVYFRADPRRPGFSEPWLEAARQLGQAQAAPPALFDHPLAAVAATGLVVELEDWLYFYANPARYLLRKRLGLALDDADDSLENREAFELDYFGREAVQQQVFVALQRGYPAGVGSQLARAAAILPAGGIGEALYRREQSKLDAVASQWLENLPATVMEPLPVCFSANGMTLNGWLRGLCPAGLVEYRLRPKPSARDQFILWLRHLLLCWLAPAGIELRSQLHTLELTIRFAPVVNPEPLLAAYLEAYRQGLSRPLPFFVKASTAYAACWREDQDHEAALDAARNEWKVPEYRHNGRYGECENPYYQAVYRAGDPLPQAEFAELAKALALPMLDAMEQK